ncbi:MAG: hypothetical protein LH606_08830 [Cytophagaceae bacterium]|nr:hypothetical protein [Cytophagaceae bacterium]
METKKTFDAVGFMREQRDRISREYNEKPEALEEKSNQVRQRFNLQGKKNNQPV